MIDYRIVTIHNQSVYRLLRLGAMRRFLQMDIPWHDRHHSGEQASKIADGIKKVIEVMDYLSWEFIPTLVQAVLSLIPLAILSPYAALVAIAAFGGFMVVTRAAHRKREELRVQRYDLKEKEEGSGDEIMKAVKTAVLYGQEERLMRVQEDMLDQMHALGSQEARLGIFKYNVIRIRLLDLAMITMISIWLMQFQDGSLYGPNFYFLYQLSQRLFLSFWRFARLLDRAAEASEGAKRLVNLLDETPAQEDEGEDPQLILPTGIRLQNVSFAYPGAHEGQHALRDLVLDIAPGSVVAFVGPTGAGKSTLWRVITGMQPIHEGTIEIGGIDIRKWRPSTLKRMFAYVPQGDEVDIFSGSIRDNIAFSNFCASLADVVHAARMACIHDFIETLPHGYNTKVGERGKKLSGGQKQRIALARAILADRPILVLDEATSSVDSLTEAKIQEAINQFLQDRDKTTIVIAHRLSTIKNADIICVVEEGRIIEQGTHEQLVMLGGLYAQMWTQQTKEEN